MPWIAIGSGCHTNNYASFCEADALRRKRPHVPRERLRFRHHAFRFLCVFLLFGAQLIGFIPLAALAGVLVVVSWNMIEKGLLVALLRNWRSALVLMITFGLTVAINLTTGILAGCLASIVLQWKSQGRRVTLLKIDAGQ
jgi:hypothetical protein